MSTDRDGAVEIGVLVQPRFELGVLVITQAAERLLAPTPELIRPMVVRHLVGDWGDVPEEDRAANDAAVVSGGRLHSAYKAAGGEPVWVVTEAVAADGFRPMTTILVPDEY